MEKSAGIVYPPAFDLAPAMTAETTRDFAEKNVKAILEWLAMAHGRTTLDDAEGLLAQLQSLRGTPVGVSQRLRVLDLLYSHAVHMTLAQFPSLQETSLPISRRLRHAVRNLQELLETLAQDYTATLSMRAEEDPAGRPRAPHITLRRVMHCLAWHLGIGFLVAAPPAPGIWQQLHGCYRTSRRLGTPDHDAGSEERRIAQIYASTLLVAAAQPASFTSRELEFVTTYIDECTKAVDIRGDVPPAGEAIFWVDPSKDLPAQALARRPPPPEAEIYYFACDMLAQGAEDHLTALRQGVNVSELGLPEFASSAAGQGVLRRLSTLWGRPGKRKYSRRRQSYRADLCSGLDRLWQLLRHPDQPPATSEWMVINESPDGYSMMHVNGPTERLRVGDVVAVHPHEGHVDTDHGPWHICIVRWAISENPAHIEVGLQVLSPRGMPAQIAAPHDTERHGKREAVLLPKLPPLRPLPALIVPTGTVTDREQKLIVLVETGNFEIREYRATEVNEQTSSVEMFTVRPDERV